MLKKSLGDMSVSPTLIIRLELSIPNAAIFLSIVRNSGATPYLKVTLLQSISRGIKRTSSCSTLITSTFPIPPGKKKSSGSEKHSVQNQPLSFSHIIGGFRHSSIVVQIEKPKETSLPGTT